MNIYYINRRFFKILLLFSLVSIFISCENQDEIPSFEGNAIFYPTGNESLVKGKVYTVRWSASDFELVDIDLCFDSQVIYSIANNLKNGSKFFWELTDDIPVGSNYSIKISNSDNRNSFCITESNIKIIAKPETSTFTDSRDGQTYDIVKIGNQWWMAENFNFYTDIGCFPYENIQHANLYGKAYSYQTAMEYSPEGWHLPTDDDWKELEEYLGLSITELDKEGERGKNVGDLLKFDGGLGFNAIYGGYKNSGYDGIAHIGWEAHFLTSTKSSEGTIVRIISKQGSGIIRLKAINHGGSSVRYIKDN